MDLQKKYPLLPTVITVILFVVLMGLGTWQVHRLHWKTELLTSVELKMSQPVATLEQVLKESDPQDWQYRRIKVKGKFLHEKELYLMPRSYMGMPGYQVITPFQVSTGEVILINRGWVPKEHQASVIARSDEEQEIIGSIRLNQEQRFFHPQNEIMKKEIFYVSTGEIAKAFDLMTLLPFYLIEEPGEAKPYSWPKPVGGSPVNVVNNHFMYAVIWYALGAILLLFYGFYIRQIRHVHHRKHVSVTPVETKPIKKSRLVVKPIKVKRAVKTPKVQKAEIKPSTKAKPKTKTKAKSKKKSKAGTEKS